MLLRIKPEQVRLGMFVEAVDGTWEGQRFWRTRFLLEQPHDLETLQKSGVKGVLINISNSAGAAITPTKKARCPLPDKEVARALETIEQSKPLIKSMFEDVQMGSNLPIDTATKVVEDITACMRDSSRAMIHVTRLRSRDEYTFVHSIAVAALMVHFGRSINLDDAAVQELAMGGLLHDVGKMKIPLEILTKSGRLTDEEMALVRKHPQYSFDILSQQQNMSETVLDICLHHHERLDGKGYPKGLSHCRINLPVRIASICDVYDALTSRRPYKTA